MHGKFSSYRAVRCADGSMGPSANGYLGANLGEDSDGNVWLYGRPRKGESVKDWIRRGVEDQLAVEAAKNSAVWWARYRWHVSVAPEFGTPGEYSVHVYSDGAPGDPLGVEPSPRMFNPVKRDGKLVRTWSEES
jgi:hypothetical protein